MGVSGKGWVERIRNASGMKEIRKDTKKEGANKVPGGVKFLDTEVYLSSKVHICTE